MCGLKCIDGRGCDQCYWEYLERIPINSMIILILQDFLSTVVNLITVLVELYISQSVYLTLCHHM